MSELFKSASKITLMVVSFGLTAGLFFGKISGEQYMSIASMIMGFYYGNRKPENQ